LLELLPKHTNMATKFGGSWPASGSNTWSPCLSGPDVKPSLAISCQR